MNKKESLNALIIAWILMLCFFRFQAATCVSTGSGLWSNSATWSCGAVPACGDSITILAGHTVSISANANYAACGVRMSLTILGTVYFQGGSKLRLPCGSNIYIFTGGSIQSDGAGASNQLYVCGTNYWSGNDGTLSGPSCVPPNVPPCAAVLPIELINFSAVKCDNNVCLFWETASEKNNAFFEVQKLTTGSEFNTIGTVPSKGYQGNSKTNLKYSFQDQELNDGLIYYRLKQVDLDRSFKTYQVIVIDSKQQLNNVPEIFPNPNNGSFAIKAQTKNVRELKVVIINSLGEVMQDLLLTNSENKEVSIINTSVILKPGLYICSFYLDDQVYNTKMLVE